MELARQQKLDPVIGRDAEIRNVIRILSRKTKNNPVLIGEPGVGTTAIAEGLAPVSYTHLDVYKRQGLFRPRLSAVWESVNITIWNGTTMLNTHR